MSAMGDVAMLPHALRALKEAHPDVRVTVATKPSFRPFFEGLDVEFLDIDTKGDQRTLWGMCCLAAEARRRGVDAVADAHGVMRSWFFRVSMWLRGIPVTYIRKGRKSKRRILRGDASIPARHSVHRYCDVIRRLGLDFENPEPVVKSVRTNPLGEKQGVWVGFAPFSAQDGKTYPLDQSREAVRLLSACYDRVFVHSGGGAEAEFAQQMESLYSNVTALYGKMGLKEELNLIANLDCVVSMDSLVMHMAALVATPVVSVWGATHPALGFFGYGCDPRGIVQADMVCRPCSVFGNKPCKYGDYRCLKAVTPQMIVDRVADILGK